MSFPVPNERSRTHRVWALKSSWPFLLAAWLVSAVATLGALFMGEVLGMTPCVLCWYQRIFMFPIAIVLGIACALDGDHRQGALSAMALALGGLAVALYHTLLVAGAIPAAWVPCGAGASCTDQPLDIFNGVQIPWLSLAAFALIAGFLIPCLRKTRR